MTTHLIHIGNSLGIRIPKAIINQLGFKEDTDLSFRVTDNGLLISPISQAREGWSEAFALDQKNKLIMEDQIINLFDEEEWEW